MSFLRKLIGGDPARLIEKANGQLEAGEPGNAKLTFEKAMDLLPANERPPIEEKIARCKDEIARQRIALGNEHADHGDMRLAFQEWGAAVEVAHSDDVRDEAQAKLDTVEQEEAVEQAVSTDMTDEERLTLLAGQWEDAQADEYESHGEAVFDALVLMQKEQFAEARKRLEALVDAADEPRYLWLEVGRARMLDDDAEGAREALAAFLDELGPDEGGEAKLQAHLQLAGLADEADDFDAAMAHLEGAVDALPGDYRPYLVMGGFLRQKDHASEAIEVLKTALSVSTTTSPDWRLLQELGLAHTDTGKRTEAIGYFEQVIAFFSDRQFTDFPPATAVPLAKAYEEDGRLDRAAGIYRTLADGSDHENHARYHFEAGRLLLQLDMGSEAHRMLKRAEALSESDADLAEEIRALLSA